jgi:ribosomal protein L37AE/L43A
MNTCPCCSEQLLRHARHNSIYWFCPHCRQEMPNFSTVLTSSRKSTPKLDRLANALELTY